MCDQGSEIDQPERMCDDFGRVDLGTYCETSQRDSLDRAG